MVFLISPEISCVELLIRRFWVRIPGGALKGFFRYFIVSHVPKSAPWGGHEYWRTATWAHMTWGTGLIRKVPSYYRCGWLRKSRSKSHPVARQVLAFPRVKGGITSELVKANIMSETLK